MSESIKKLVEDSGGEVKEVVELPDGSGAMIASFPLPEDHWLYKPGYNTPPAPIRLGTEHPRRSKWVEDIRAAAKYAIRSSTMNGKEIDFDPDAMVQNFIVGMVGYYTPDGKSSLDEELDKIKEEEKEISDVTEK